MENGGNDYKKDSSTDKNRPKEKEKGE